MSTHVTKENLQEFASKLHAKNKTLFALKSQTGTPSVVTIAASMTDQTKIYVYMGTETGYIKGGWYYYSGSAWTFGGMYNSGDWIGDDLKQALLQLASKVAYIDDDGQDYYDALESALYPDATLVSISAVYTQSGDVFESTPLDDLKTDLVVTAHYSDASTATITAYTLSGTLEVGTSTITVTYSGKTTTFDVTVSLVPSEYTVVDYISSNVDGSPSASKLTSTPYIKTAFPASDTDILDYTVKLVYVCNFQSVTAIPFGGRDGTSNSSATRGCVVNLGSTDTVLNFGNVSGQTALIRSATGSAISTDTKHTIEIKNGNMSLDGNVVIQTNATSAVQLATYKWGLFGRNNKGQWGATTSGGDLSPMIGKIYEFSITDANGDYVLRYIPCKRNLDDVYGMYDTVSETFYTSEISTGFIGGND